MARRDGQESVSRSGPAVSRARPIDCSPRAALRAFAGPRFAWRAPGEPDVVGCGAVATVTAEGPDRFETIRSEAGALFDSLAFEGAEAARPRLVGGFAFHDEGPPSPWRGFPAAGFVLPRAQLVRAEGESWLTVTDRGPDADPQAVEAALEAVHERIASAPTARAPPPGIESTTRTPDREGWRRQVAAALDRIAAGELEKVVLAQTLRARLHGSFRLPDTLERLRDAYPDCYGFAVDPGLDSVFFGATPERLITRRGDRVETEALAGSIARGGTDAEDRRLARRLERSEKIRHEQGLVVDAIREQLATVAADVTVDGRRVRKLANVQHLETPVTGRLGGERHVLELAEALHPTPAVGGLPPDAASRTIRETERFDRGWYASPVGWFDADGDGTFAVAIRSAVAADAEATLFAGNGIVADSDPDEEWNELQLKYRPILDQLR